MTKIEKPSHEHVQLIVNYMGYKYEQPKGMSFTYLMKPSNILLDETSEPLYENMCTKGNEKFHLLFEWSMPVIEKLIKDGIVAEVRINDACNPALITDNGYFECNLISNSSFQQKLFEAIVNVLRYLN